MKKTLLLLFGLLTLNTYAQSPKEQAYDLGMEAIKKMESGDIDGAIALLEKSQKLDPDNIDYPYEIGFAHYLNKDYESAIKICKKLLKHDDINDRVFQMLGNCYDLNKQPEKAIETYEQGLKEFPESGNLYLERGNMEVFEKKYNEALYYFEKGIEVDPKHSSNYYWAAKIYLSSNNEVWGMIYGEIMMNLERNSKRTVEISEMLYNTYTEEIKKESDTSYSVSFCQNMVMTLDDLKDPDNFKLPFCMVYEPTLLMATVFSAELDINALDTVRQNFVKTYYDMGHHETHPNALFDYQKKILDAGHMEAYNHWILMKGDEEAFGAWHGQNGDKWDSFVNWFTDNPMMLDEKNRFYREQY